MSEVSPVGKLNATLLAFALTAGAAGTLVDLRRAAKADGTKAVRIGLMSYGRWNRRLLHEPTPAPSTSPSARLKTQTAVAD